MFAAAGIQVITTPIRSPRANAYAERFVGTLRRECLDHLLIYGQRHPRSVLTDYQRHYNSHRPHQVRALRPPLHDAGQVIDMNRSIQRRTVLAGLLNQYHRAA